MIKFLLPLLLSVVSLMAQQMNPGGDTEVYFSPRGGCMSALIRQYDSAREIILVQAYAFTSLRIEAALERAAARGVRVEVILDRSWSVNSPRVEQLLIADGIVVRIDGIHPISHNKISIIDGQRVVTGSFNYTTQAERYNAENLVIIHNSTIAAKYTQNFLAHKSHSHGR